MQITFTEQEILHLETILKYAVQTSHGIEKKFTKSLLDRLIESQSFEPHASLH